MADEQTILLGPEEELTSVRERLERTQARRIILVIPAQTQLRSHVGWRLIHARMRELGKELLVISPDRQVRAVARAAGFQVAETRQDAPSNRPKLAGGTRPGASNARGTSRSRLDAGRREAETQARRRLSSNFGQGRGTRPSAPSQREERPLPPLSAVPSTPFFEEEEEDLGQAYEFSIGTPPAPSTRPSTPVRGEGEEEAFRKTYEADYRQAQDILKAAQEGQPTQGKQVRERREPASRAGSGRIVEGEIEDLGDMGQIDLPEIHVDDSPDLSEKRPRSGSRNLQNGPRHSPRSPRPAPPGSDDDDELYPTPSIPARDGSDSPGSTHPSRGLAQRPRSSQAFQPGAGSRPSQTLRPDAGTRGTRPSQGIGQTGSAASKPLDMRAGSRPSQTLKPKGGSRPAPGPGVTAGARGSRPSQGLGEPTGTRGSKPLDARTGSRPSQTLKPAAQRNAGPRVAPVGQQLRPRAANRPRATHGNRRGVAIFFIVLVLLLLLGGVLFYTVPSATVTLSLAASPYTQAVHINATLDTRANVTDRAPAHLLETTLSVSNPPNQPAVAHGTTSVGNAQASGSVSFTFTGNTNITIPRNTRITTPGGTVFLTQAEVLITADNSPPVPIIAQQPGESGNVASNTITVLPPESLSAIAQYSHLDPGTVTSHSLTVTNAAPTGGGGATTVPTVTQNDAQTLERNLHQQIQQKARDWLSTQVHIGDVSGQLVPDVLNSAHPLTQEQMQVTPAVGQPDAGGTFSGTLTLQVRMLVARAKDVQAVASTQLNAAALKLRPAKMLAVRLPVSLAQAQSTQSQDGSMLAISARATGELIPQIDTNGIASSITGKGVVQARGDLMHGVGVANLAEVKDVKVIIFPAFFSILPVQAGRIRVVLKPLLPTSTPRQGP